MGIVRNLVVRFKNWYKDLVNEVINNVNKEELTDDSKLRDSSKLKRCIALLGAIILTHTPISGLTENSKVELTTETKITEQAKDIPYEELTTEEQLASAAIGVIAGASSEGVIESAQHETRQFTSVEELMDFKNSIIQKKCYNVLRQIGVDSETLEKEINGLVHSLSYDSCIDIEKELEKRKDFIQEPRYQSFVFNNYNLGALGIFNILFERSLSDPEIDLSEFILDEVKRDEFKKLYDPIRASCLTRKNKRAFDANGANQLKDATITLVDVRNTVDETSDVQSLIYLALISSSAEHFISENSKKIKEGTIPNMDSKNSNEVVKACESALGEIREASFYDIYAYDPYTVQFSNN